MTSKRAPQRLEWTDEGEGAFQAILKFFCSAPLLCVPMHDDHISIVTDASGRGLGGILQVQRQDEWRPVAYYSHQLRGVEQRYSATELEALALVETINHFSQYLYGRTFEAFTDHKPLESLMTSKRLNPRLARLSLKLQHWLVTIVYLPGELNTLADALSREEAKTTDNNLEEMFQQTENHLEPGDVEGTPPH